MSLFNYVKPITRVFKMNLYQFVQNLMRDALNKDVEIVHAVQYARRGKIASQYFLGREYPWDPKMGAYGRWITGRGGAKYFINFEKLVQRAIKKNNPMPEEFAGMFGKRPENNATQENILEEMRYHEYFVRVLLTLKGRTILLDPGKEDVAVYNQKSLESKTDNSEYIGKTVALYRIIPRTNINVLAQRRIYDEDGTVLQDFDYWHSGGDVHVFPHIHVWFSSNYKDRSHAIRFFYND